MSGVAVLGPGGVGGFLTAALTRAGEDVVVVARERTAAQLSSRGLHVRSERLGEFSVPVRAVAQLSEPVEVLLVATKATSLHAALGRVRSDPALIVPLLNGLEHIALLRGRFGAERVVAATIRIDSDRPALGEVVQSGPGAHVELAGDDPRLAARLPELAGRLERAGVSVRIGDSEAEVMWSKLVRLVALSCTTSAADASIGEIRADPGWWARLAAVVGEAAAVAAAEGAPLDVTARLAELERAHPSLGSSMRRDIAAGRPPELDAIAGAVLRAGRRHGLSCPVLGELAAEVAARARIPAPAA